MIARLFLTDFRSYATARLDPAPGLIVLTGENGAGKTNILEAVSLLAPGRGLRGAALAEMARQDGPGGFTVAADLVGTAQIGIGTQAGAPDRRIVRINGAPAAANALAEWISVLWITPAMDRLFVDPASGRRRFLDRLVLALEPGHASLAGRYEAAMRERNRLLAGGETPDPAWLGGIEAQMATLGRALAEARSRTVHALSARLADQPEGPFARAALTLAGWNAGPDDGQALARNRARDAAAGRALEGSHRQDLQVAHAGKARPAAHCSTGEQKALLLGLILAHADLVADRSRTRPVLLLDEIAAHLDPRRRAALFARLADGGGQVWMTGTEAALFADAPVDAQRLHIANGTIGLS